MAIMIAFPLPMRHHHLLASLTHIHHSTMTYVFQVRPNQCPCDLPSRFTFRLAHLGKGQRSKDQLGLFRVQWRNLNVSPYVVAQFYVTTSILQKRPLEYPSVNPGLAAIKIRDGFLHIAWPKNRDIAHSRITFHFHSESIMQRHS